MSNAYAILDSNGILTFFRSENTYSTGADQTVTDIEGNEYTGTLYANIENLEASSSSNIPWYSVRSNITTVTFAEDQIIQPISTAYWFNSCKNLSVINNIDLLNTSNVTNMKYMFGGCYNNSFNPDVSNWDTSNVINMSGMFSNCWGNSFNPDMSNWDVSNVTDMNFMFTNSYGSSFNPDISNWDTSNVTNMERMFNDCYGNTFNPGVSNWNTSNVINMERMFQGCYGNSFNPDVSNWDTSNVTNMSCMFWNCYGNSFNPDVSNWNTSNVTDMSVMFSNCYGNAFNPDVSNWDTSCVEDMSNIFNNCHGEAFNPDVSNWDTSNVINMPGVFSGCYGNLFTTLNLNNWDISNVTNIRNMFNNCNKLTTIYCDNVWEITNSNDMFKNCNSLIGGYETSYDSAYKDITYARPDTLRQPGYFTGTTYTITYNKGNINQNIEIPESQIKYKNKEINLDNLDNIATQVTLNQYVNNHRDNIYIDKNITFNGWKNQNDDEYAGNAGYNVNENSVLTAQWLYPELELPTDPISSEMRTFKYWSLDNPKTLPSDTQPAVVTFPITLTDSITLYAIYDSLSKPIVSKIKNQSNRWITINDIDDTGNIRYYNKNTLINQGANNKPVYYANGQAKTINFEINSNVPENATFTDTKYNLVKDENGNLLFTSSDGETSQTIPFPEPEYYYPDNITLTMEVINGKNTFKVLHADKPVITWAYNGSTHVAAYGDVINFVSSVDLDANGYLTGFTLTKLQLPKASAVVSASAPTYSEAVVWIDV